MDGAQNNLHGIAGWHFRTQQMAAMLWQDAEDIDCFNKLSSSA